MKLIILLTVVSLTACTKFAPVNKKGIEQAESLNQVDISNDCKVDIFKVIKSVGVLVYLVHSGDLINAIKVVNELVVLLPKTIQDCKSSSCDVEIWDQARQYILEQFPNSENNFYDSILSLMQKDEGNVSNPIVAIETFLKDFSHDEFLKTKEF